MGFAVIRLGGILDVMLSEIGRLGVEELDIWKV